MWRASSAFPLAIRVRVSGESSDNDSSSSLNGGSDGNSEIDVAEEDEGGYETAEDDVNSLGRSFVPRVRLTEDDDDDSDVDGETNDYKEDNLMVGVENSVADNSFRRDYDGFPGLLVSGRKDNGFVNGNSQTGDDLGARDSVSETLVEMQLQVKEKDYNAKVEMSGFHGSFENSGVLELADFKLEIKETDVVEVQVEEDQDSFVANYEEIGEVSSVAVEQSNDISLELTDLVVESSYKETEKINEAIYIEEFRGESASVRENSGLSDGINENHDSLFDEDPIITSLELQILLKQMSYFEKVKLMHDFDDSFADDGGLVNDVKFEMDENEIEEEIEKFVDFIDAGCDTVEAVSSGNGEQNDDFFLPLRGLMVESSSIDSEKNKHASNVETTLMSSLEVELSALKFEAQAGYLKNSKNEDNPEECAKIGAIGIVTSNQHLNEVEPKQAEVAKFHVWEAMLEASQVEADSTFEVTNDVDSTSRKNLELPTLPDSKVSEPKYPERCAENMDSGKNNYMHENACPTKSEKAKDSAGKFLSLSDYEDAHENYNSCKDSSAENHILKVMEEDSFDSHSDCNHSQIFDGIYDSDRQLVSKHSQNYSQILDGQVSYDSDKQLESIEDGCAKELFDTFALAELLNASSGVSSLTSQDKASIFSIKPLIGFRPATSFLRPANSPFHSTCIMASSNLKSSGDFGNNMNDEEERLLLKVNQIRVNYLRHLHRLGYFADDALPNRVLYWLSFINGVREGSKIHTVCLKEKCKDAFTFSCNILVIGKTGVGKSAAINSIFQEERAFTDPFFPGTTSVTKISGLVDGVYISIIDTPGLSTSLYDQDMNIKILSSVKKCIKKCPPNVVLFVDRLDVHTRDLDNQPLLEMITSILDPSIWHNAIISLTHAASAIPNGPDGSPLSYESVVAQKYHSVQQSIRQAAGDMHLVNSLALLENLCSCSRNMDGECLHPNGLKWRSWLLLLCYSSKILSDANSIVKFERASTPHHNYPFPTDLTSLLQFKVQGDYNYDSDIDLNSLTVEVPEEHVEYDLLPPELMRRFHFQNVTNEHISASFGTPEDKLRRLKNQESGNQGPKETATTAEGYKQEINPAVVSIPFYNMVSSLSFDNENPTKRCRCLEPKSKLLTRPVLCLHHRDHDSGYDDLIIQFPLSLAIQITIEDKEFNGYLDSSIASRRGENGSTFATVNAQPVALRDNKMLGRLKINKTACVGMSRADSDATYEANLELSPSENCSSRNRLSTFGPSVLKWADFTVGANLQLEFSTGQNSRMSVSVGLNNQNAVSIISITTKQIHNALSGLFSSALSLCRSICAGKSN